MVENLATTLWENWEDTEYTTYGSRNHIMFGSQSAWYYKVLAGIFLNGNVPLVQSASPRVNALETYLRDLAPSNTSGSFLVIRPEISAVVSNLTSVSASILTHRGMVESIWSMDNSLYGMCGQDSEGYNITLSCMSGVITSIDFASFGTATGTCGDYHINPACNANDTVSIVSQLCLDQSTCTIFVSDSVFGDPCVGTLKHLYVQVSGCQYPVFQQNVTIPVGQSALVSVETFFSPNDVEIMESGMTVWAAGKYQAGQSGFYGASSSGGFNSSSVVFSIGSGYYFFSVATPPYVN